MCLAGLLTDELGAYATAWICKQVHFPVDAVGRWPTGLRGGCKLGAEYVETCEWNTDAFYVSASVVSGTTTVAPYASVAHAAIALTGIPVRSGLQKEVAHIRMPRPRYNCKELHTISDVMSGLPG